jgi:16S rRNA (cytidine1402-2'-O)-methyltransferase
VLYEAPHRLGRTLADLAAAFGGDRRVALARELTKLHEEVVRATLDEAVAWASEREPVGEFVVVLEGAPAPEAVGDAEVEAAVEHELSSGASTRDAAAAVAANLGVPRRRAYDVAVRLTRSGRT